LQVNLPPGIIKQAAESLGVQLAEVSISNLEEEIQRTNELYKAK